MPRDRGILNESQTVEAPQRAIGAENRGSHEDFLLRRIYFQKSIYIRHTILITTVPGRATITPASSAVTIAFSFTRSQGGGTCKELSERWTKNLIKVSFVGSMRFEIAYTACNLCNHHTNSSYSINIVGGRYSPHFTSAFTPNSPPHTSALLIKIDQRFIYT